MAKGKNGGLNMKKSILLFALPALLALSGCSKVNDGALEPVIENEFIFAEDTEEHCELFGGRDGGLEFKRQPLLAMTPGEGSLTKPVVGYQYRAAYEEDKNGDEEPEEYTAVRFLAGVADLNVKAVWTRAAYRADNGNIVGSRATVESKTAYGAVNDGGSPFNATDWEDENGDHPFNYFVVYTIYDIPLASIDDYYFAAYLTLSNPEDASEYIDSDEVVTTSDPADLGNDTTWMFPANKTGYFALVFGNTENQFISEDSPTRNDSGNLASFTLNLDEDQEFIIIQNDANSKFYIYYGDVLDYAGNSAVLESFENAAGFICAKEAGKFALYLNNDAQLYRFKYGPSGFYVRGDAAGDADWGLHDEYQFTACPTEDGNVGILLNVHLGTAAKGFKIGDSSWNNEWGYWGYKRDGGGYNWRGQGNANITGGAAGNFSAHASEGGDVKNIVCNTAGYYNIYLTNSGYISFELVSAD